MRSQFIIKKNKPCEISIIGVSDWYIDEDITKRSYRSYKYSETVTINYVYSANALEEYTLEETLINYHEGPDRVDVTFNNDGVYKICHIVIPTNKWYEEVKDNDPELLELIGDDLAYYDLDNGKIVGSISNSSIVAHSEAFTFNLSNLTECFINVNQKVFDALIGSCSNSEIKDLEFKRDLVFMAANSIQFSVEFGRYFEAQRTLERVTTCTDICDNFNDSNNGCGCSKR